MKNKIGQIWVETVLYTLIGLSLVGIVLAIVTPRINETQDRILVEQAIDSLGSFDEKMNEILISGSGNVRDAIFLLNKGELSINASGDEIFITLDDLKKPYSELGIEIDEGRVNILSEEVRGKNSVRLSLSYSNTANLTYAGEDAELRSFSSAKVPYRFSISNLGNNIIDIREAT